MGWGVTVHGSALCAFGSMALLAGVALPACFPDLGYLSADPNDLQGHTTNGSGGADASRTVGTSGAAGSAMAGAGGRIGEAGQTGGAPPMDASNGEEPDPTSPDARDGILNDGSLGDSGSRPDVTAPDATSCAGLAAQFNGQAYATFQRT